MQIGRNHPLRRLFAELVKRRFFEDMRVQDARVAVYVSDLLTDFTHTDNLYRLLDARGRRLAESFELCAYGLNLVKQDLQRFEQEYYRRVAAQVDAGSAA